MATLEDTPPTEPTTRFCPGCGSVGPVPAKYRDCCPDGDLARIIPEQLANRCHDLFKGALDAARVDQSHTWDLVREALEEAQSGLEWYRDRYPDAVDGSDDEANERIGRALASLGTRAAPTTQHPDDEAVDRFAAAMKAKLAKAREKGRSGWDDRTTCTQDQLARALRQHTHKGDPVDVANFAMFLHARGESTALHFDPDLTAAIAAAPKDATVIEHNGFPVFINRGTQAWKELADALASVKELGAVVTSIKHLAGEIILQMPEGEEVPQWLAAGAEVSLLTQGGAE